MTLSWKRVLTIAKRDYRYTVRQRAFALTLIGLPLLYATLFTVMIKRQQAERVSDLRSFTAMGVVDSSGLFANAPRALWTDEASGNPFSEAPERRARIRTEVVTFADQPAGEAALRAGRIKQLLVLPPDYGTTGVPRRFAGDNGVFSTGDRLAERWIIRGLLASMDSARIETITRPLRREALYTLDRDGRFALKNRAREAIDFLLPFALGLLLGLAIVIGGQYLLQGMAEEKESRILESMLCTVTPEELMLGKLIGLGGAGLTLVLGWIVMMSTATGGAAAAAGLLNVSLPAPVIAMMVLYFLFGYLFYASIMMGIGSIASTAREAQQFSIAFTMISFVPFYLMSTLIGHPDSPLALGLSLFPPTAPVSGMLRLAAPGAHIPVWQLAASLALLGGSAFAILMLSARVFRVGMLMYGKVPNLPEILRWIRQK